MPDIFLSYSRENRPTAQKLVAALEAHGCSVWWDGLLEGGERFSRKTAAALEAADVVVVLWSKTSVESHWVHDEATHGRDKGRLVPVSIDGSEAPLGFRQFQVLDLAHWKGKADAPEIADVVRAIGIAAGQPDLVPRPVPAIATPTTRRNLILAGSGAALVAAGGGAAAWRSGWFESAGIANSVAVLPFKNLSGDPGQDYFAEGLAEEIRSALARNPLLTVAATASSSMFLDGAVPVPEVANKLGVAYILDGSVRRAASSVRIAVQLIDGKTGLVSWSRTNESLLAKTLEVQSQLARTVTEVLTAQVEGRGVAIARGDSSRSGGTSNIAAFEAYLQGRDAFNKNFGPAAAIAKLDDAIEIDPKYAAAHAERSRMLTHNALSLIPTSKESHKALKQAIIAARRAVSLAPSLAIAHSHLGFALTYGNMSVAEASAPYERSRELGWGDAHVVISYAAYLSTRGQHKSALSVYKRAIAIDPLNSKWLSTLASIQFNARLFEESFATWHKSMSKPDDALWTWQNALVNLYRNQIAEADKAISQLKEQDLIDHMRAIIEYKKGNFQDAEKSLTAITNRHGDASFSSAGWIHAARGEKSLALDALEKAYDLGDWSVIEAYSDRVLMFCVKNRVLSACIRRWALRRIFPTS